MSFQAVNPATGEFIKNYQEMNDKEVHEILVKTEQAFQGWRNVSFSERASKMKRTAEVLRANTVIYAKLMSEEMGKTLVQGKGEIEKCAWVCDYFAENGEKILSDEMVMTDASRSYIRFAPLGVVLAIMPWNFPFWQVFRFAAPALMAGNAAVMKHASNVPGCSLALEKLFSEAGFPTDLFRTLLISGARTDTLMADPIIRAVTLTGSSEAGRKVAETAGRYLKKSVLELGGSDAFMILDDADIMTCATAATRARLICNGQSCVAAKRFIVLEKIADAFEKAFVEKMAAAQIGDPLDEKTEVGPLAREDLLMALDRQVRESVKKGAKILTGGKRLDRKGFFYAPTVLAHVKKGMPAYDEEMFGPVAAVIRVKDDKEAVRVANDSPYGLGVSIWIKDSKRGEELAKQCDAGVLAVNDIVKSDPRLPFGGVKESGYGRELSSYGMKEFVNIQSLWIK